MSEKPENPPAFPRSYGADGHNGMTMRDWFAGQALAALVARHRSDVPWSLIASSAYGIADDMLTHRAKDPATCP